jgi:hypothetical protein
MKATNFCLQKSVMQFLCRTQWAWQATAEHTLSISFCLCFTVQRHCDEQCSIASPPIDRATEEGRLEASLTPPYCVCDILHIHTPFNLSRTKVLTTSSNVPVHEGTTVMAVILLLPRRNLHISVLHRPVLLWQISPLLGKHVRTNPHPTTEGCPLLGNGPVNITETIMQQ